jgi:three-Cys-motif partner protein
LDGFAGPGEYQGGEEGSPIIAIRTAIEHKLPLASEIVFYFIEARSDRREHLDRLLPRRFPAPSKNIKWIVVGAEFAKEVKRILDEIDAEGSRLAPTFAFLDPFGFKGMPIELVARLLNHRSCETLITFMEKFINRFSESEFHEEALDELFGTTEWRRVEGIKDSESRRQFLLDLYSSELAKRVPDLRVRSFEMVDASNQVLYYLVFATKNVKGMDVMKEAMWSVDKTGAYRFSDLTDPHQRTLLDIVDEPVWSAHARDLVLERFRGQSVSEREVYKFVILETPYLYRKKAILWMLEDERRILRRSRRHSYPEACAIEFAS